MRFGLSAAVVLMGLLAGMPARAQTIFDDWPPKPRPPATRPAQPPRPPTTAPAPTPPTPTPPTPTPPTPTPPTPPAPPPTTPATPDPVAPAPPTPTPTPTAPPAKAPEPPLPTQKEAEKTIRELFAAAYLKTSPADKQDLAKKLLKSGEETNDDLPAKYVLLREARDLAAQAGDAETAFAAIGELEEVFAIDVLAMKTTVINTASRVTRSPTASRLLAETTMALVEELVRSDAYDRATPMTFLAEQAARASSDGSLTNTVANRCKEIRGLNADYQIVRNHIKTLETKPDDPEANLAAGRFLCLVKRDWAKGLPMLAKGSDAGYKALAAKELAATVSPPAMVELADAWWEQARADRAWRKPAEARAIHWYEKALPALTGLTKAKVENRLEQYENEGGFIDLLRLVDTAKDAVKGAWHFEGRALVSPDVPNTVSSTSGYYSSYRYRYTTSSYALLAIPYVPPEEYDLEVVAERIKGGDELAVNLVGGGKQFSAAFGGDRGKTNGLGLINGIYPHLGTYERVIHSLDPKTGNPTTVREFILKPGQIQTLRIVVRKTRVATSADGLTLVNWPADWTKVTLDPTWATTNTGQLSIGIGYGTRFIIHSMTLKPQTGRGKKLR